MKVKDEVATMSGPATGKRAEAVSENAPGQATKTHYTKKQLIDGFPVPPPRLAPVNQDLGPLRMLVGTWNGKGNTMLAVPSEKGLFRAINHPHTTETITYRPGAPVPDRGGFNQPDINLTGMSYHHLVVDTPTTEPLHEEVGFWLNMPATVDPKAPKGLVRELSIPHGNSAILFGKSERVKGPYKFPPYHAIPSPKENFPSPEIYDSENTGDVNRQLNIAQKGLTYLECHVLTVASRTPEDIVNIPFLEAQATSTSATATFVVSIVTRPGYEPFYMMQYSQVILLQFPAVKGGPMISWPHTAVATLYKTT
jgi:hypothetical protein